jgi:hypothetical protein
MSKYRGIFGHFQGGALPAASDARAGPTVSLPLVLECLFLNGE